jgi:hypothetical protein
LFVASTTNQSRLTLSGLALNVFISEYLVCRREGGTRNRWIKGARE